MLDLLSHEYFWRIPQALAGPSVYIPLWCVSSTDMWLCLGLAASDISDAFLFLTV